MAGVLGHHLLRGHCIEWRGGAAPSHHSQELIRDQSAQGHQRRCLQIEKRAGQPFAVLVYAAQRGLRLSHQGQEEKQSLHVDGELAHEAEESRHLNEH